MESKSGKKTDDDAGEVSHIIHSKYTKVAEHAVSLDKEYITDISIHRSNGPITVALTSSGSVCMVYKLRNETLQAVSQFTHSDKISSVKINPQCESEIYTSSMDGKIRLWDVRMQECVQEYMDKTGGTRVKPLTSFDVSSDNKLLCAGTELVGGDAYILFWDMRSHKLMGGYWESHTDDITQVAFRQGSRHVVATGSTDGLINVFDVTQSNEDDALTNTLNTESSVAKMRWHGHDKLSCITHTEVVQLWHVEGAGPEAEITREAIAEGLHSSTPQDCYTTDVHSSDDDLFLLAGCTSSGGHNLQALGIHKGRIRGSSVFVNNCQLIRCSAFSAEAGVILTGGEGGLVTAWSLDAAAASHRTDNTQDISGRVTKTKHSHKVKPY